MQFQSRGRVSNANSLSVGFERGQTPPFRYAWQTLFFNEKKNLPTSPAGTALCHPVIHLEGEKQKKEDKLCNVLHPNSPCLPAAKPPSLSLSLSLFLQRSAHQRSETSSFFTAAVSLAPSSPPFLPASLPSHPTRG